MCVGVHVIVLTFKIILEVVFALYFLLCVVPIKAQIEIGSERHSANK